MMRENLFITIKIIDKFLLKLKTKIHFLIKKCIIFLYGK